MNLVKRTFLVAAMLGGMAMATCPQVNAGIFYRRVAPVRHVAARVALPPYPVARRTVVGPVYRPYRPYGGFYGPGFYGPGVSIGVGIY